MSHPSTYPPPRRVANPPGTFATPPSYPSRIPRDFIPLEVILNIVRHIPHRKLAICMRVSRAFHNAAAPRLYRTVKIDFDILLTPLFDHRPRRLPLTTAGDHLPIFPSFNGTVFEARVIYTPHQRTPFLPPPLHRIPMPSRFSYTTTLTISSHTLSGTSICRDYPPLVMPLLETLTILPGAHEDHLDICHCLHSYEDDGCWDIAACSCKLLSLLRPSTLVLGNSTTGITGTGMGLWAEQPTFPPEWVKTLIIHIGTRTGIETGSSSKALFLYYLPPTVEYLRLIFESPVGDKWRFRTGGGLPRGSPVQHLWERLGMACAGDAGHMEVVGLDQIDQAWSKMTVEEMEGEVRSALNISLMLKGWEAAEAGKRVKGVMFTEKKVHEKMMRVMKSLERV